MHRWSLRDGVDMADTNYGRVLLDKRSGQYWELNDVGAVVLTSLLEGATVEDVAIKISEDFEVSHHQVESDVEVLIASLLEARVIYRSDEQS